MLKTGRVGLIGVPFGAGQGKSGVEFAPDALRGLGLSDALVEKGWEVEDLGNIRVEPVSDVDARERYPFYHMNRIGATSRVVSQHVARTLGSGRMGLHIGGDHGIALGTIDGSLRVFPDLRVIWVDAHGDSNTPETSPTGNFHGMPLAALMGVFKIRELPGFEWLGKVLRPDRIALVGVRDLDNGEKKLIDSMGIAHFSADEVRKRGAHAVIEECLKIVDPKGGAPIHYSLDIDVLDPQVAPATGTPVAGGLSLSEVETIGRTLAATERMVAMDLVEINPSLASERIEADLTLQAGLRCVLSALDRSSSQAIHAAS